MFGLRHEIQVRQPVVRFISVLMVDDFFFSKEPANGFFHYESMLQDVSFMNGSRVVWGVLVNISSSFHCFTAIPVIGFLSSREFFPFIPGRNVFASIRRSAFTGAAFSFFKVGFFYIEEFVAGPAIHIRAGFSKMFFHNDSPRCDAPPVVDATRGFSTMGL